MHQDRYYAVTMFSNEWYINNIISVLVMITALIIGNILYKNKQFQLFNLSIGVILAIRFIFTHYYHYSIDNWNIEWSLPLQMCSISAILSSLLPLSEYYNWLKKYRQLLFEFIFYFSVGAFYSFITPVYTSGNEGFIYYEYYIAHGGILFVAFYFVYFLNYKPRKNSWIKIFGYSQILLLFIHLVNLYIGGTANYFYTVEPPIADNPLVIGRYPMHIILLDIFALIHFYLLYAFTRLITKNK